MTLADHEGELAPYVKLRSWVSEEPIIKLAQLETIKLDR